MGFFDDIANTLVSAGQTVGQKAKQATDLAKSSYELKELERKLREEYALLGEKYFLEHKDEEEFSQITSLLRQMEEKKQQLKEIKKNQSCPSCGAEVDKDASYCPSCGTKMSESEADVAFAPEEEVLEQAEEKSENKTESESFAESVDSPVAEPSAFVDEEQEEQK